MSSKVQEQRFAALFNIFDVTGDGNIKAEDFETAFAPISEALADDAEATKKFNKVIRRCYLSLKIFADTDKNKSINKEEWLSWSEGFAASLAENEGKEIPQKYHHFTDAIFTSISPELYNASSETTNIREITTKEYSEWFTLMKLKGDAYEIYKSIDTDGKDSITTKEFEAALVAFFRGDADAPQVFGIL